MNKQINKQKWMKIILVAAAFVLALIFVPQITDDYMITVINSALIYFIACLGIAVILGMSGLVSFAAISFMGIGGYASAILSLKLGMAVFPSILLSIVISCAMSLVIGMILLRLSGTFFTFSTVALVQITFSIFVNWKAVTGGPDGIGGIPTFSLGSFEVTDFFQCFYILAALSLVCALAVSRLRTTNLGRAMSSVRDNEIAAEVIGINVYRTKVIAFVIAAAFASLAGALMVHTNHFISSSSFTFDQSTTFVIMTMLGGVSSTPGVFVGAFLITMLPEWLKPLAQYIQLFYGLGIMILMVFMPMGLAGVWNSFMKRLDARYHWFHKTRIGPVTETEVH